MQGRSLVRWITVCERVKQVNTVAFQVTEEHVKVKYL